jgi:hypothetical protein
LKTALANPFALIIEGNRSFLVEFRFAVMTFWKESDKVLSKYTTAVSKKIARKSIITATKMVYLPLPYNFKNISFQAPNRNHAQFEQHVKRPTIKIDRGPGQMDFF